MIDNLSQKHILARLGRIDVMIRREIYRWQSAGQEPSDSFRGLYVADQQANGMMDRPIFTNWGFSAVIGPEIERAFDEAQSLADLNIQSILNTAKDQNQILKLEHLANVFRLSQFEVDVLLICLAPTLDLRYESIYGYLQDNITLKQPSVNLVLDLLCGPGSDRIKHYTHFSADAPLLKHQLVEFLPETGSRKVPLLRQMIAIDNTISSWLLGEFVIDPNLNVHTAVIYPDDESVDLILPKKIKSQLDNNGIDRSIYVFHGPDQVSQDAAARYIATGTGRPLLQANLTSIVEDGYSIVNVIKRTFRDALLIHAIPYITSWEACIKDHKAPADLFLELCSHAGPAIVSGRHTWQAGGSQRERVFRWVEFPIPPFPERLLLWKHFTERHILSDNLDFIPLAGQFQLSTGQIRDAAATAMDIAERNGGVIKGRDLFAAARSHSNPNLAGLARKINPRYGWDDIVLPGDQVDLLNEIVSTVRCRPKVLDEWGIGRKLASSRGVTALFSGPPGTGKTMAAEIIAAELNLDLYKIDLSTVVSKYIGETEKNLERIFNEAETSNAILFFDEADALFGKRSEVRDSHDRYANIEISFLLQRMEAYNGVTILATNLRANLDDAFTRRLQFAVDFPFPEEIDRLRIWQTLFPKDIPKTSNLDFVMMADKFKLAGGNIRNIIVNAAYLAADDGQFVTMDHLLHGARRELQKMGRLVGEDYQTVE
jgi:ATP-dependent 26S proteasome regulatory subunit